MARKGRRELKDFSFSAKRSWEDHLADVLSTKPAEVVQEAVQVLEEHGCYVEVKLKSELY